MTTQVTEILFILPFKLYLPFFRFVTMISDIRKLKINFANYCKKNIVQHGHFISKCNHMPYCQGAK